MNVEQKNLTSIKQLKIEAGFSAVTVMFGLALLPNFQKMANFEIFATYVGAFLVGAGAALMFKAFHDYKNLHVQNNVREP